jgi:hypothetical protein
MKKIFIIYFLMYTSMNLFSQNYDYGLSQDDLNLLLGYFVPDIEALKQRGSDWSFSWGKQTVIDTDGDFVIIDYEVDVNWKIDKKYERYLVINDSGFNLLITNIEKLSANKFKLSIFSMQYGEEQYREIWGLRDEGYIIITFLNNTHTTIEKTNSIMGLFNYKEILLKTAGPYANDWEETDNTDNNSLTENTKTKSEKSPLPLWAWLVIGGAVVVVGGGAAVFAIKMRK